ncbi:sugar transferase [candidate division KSB1 bacterium]|nr:sugar transferase [candidate division KSB1 bacterium]
MAYRDEKTIGGRADAMAKTNYQLNRVFDMEMKSHSQHQYIDMNQLGTRVDFHQKFWTAVFSPILFAGSVFMYLFAPSKVFRENSLQLIWNRIAEQVIRVFDVSMATIGIIMFLPIFMIIPLLIKLDSNGPVFYTQLRVGKNRRRKSRRAIPADITTDRRMMDRRSNNYYGRLFYIIKFRTMREDAEKKCGPVWASDNDPRITAMGRFLRKTHLDEIPQLINILRGEMSFVGPRPERPHFVSQFADQIPNYVERLSKRPGLTGLAQVRAGYDNSLESVKRKLRYDLFYNENWTMSAYFKIIFLTIYGVAPGKFKAKMNELATKYRKK